MSAPASDLPRTSAPARRALANAGITTLAQLARHSEAEIRGLHGMGPKALSVLTDALSAQGLAFQTD